MAAGPTSMDSDSVKFVYDEEEYGEPIIIVEVQSNRLEIYCHLYLNNMAVYSNDDKILDIRSNDVSLILCNENEKYKLTVQNEVPAENEIIEEMSADEEAEIDTGNGLSTSYLLTKDQYLYLRSGIAKYIENEVEMK